jgi:hypothetical protein
MVVQGMYINCARHKFTQGLSPCHGAAFALNEVPSPLVLCCPPPPPNAQSVFNKALEACDGDFRASLAVGVRSSMPDAAWLASARQGLAQGEAPGGGGGEGYMHVWAVHAHDVVYCQAQGLTRRLRTAGLMWVM